MLKASSGENGGLTLSATDLELYVETRVDAAVSAPGEVVLPARYFVDIVRRIPPVDLELHLDTSNRVVTLRWGRSVCRIHGSPADEFPERPDVPREDCVALPARMIHRLIQNTLIAVSTDETRPVLTGALWRFGSERLTVVAIDGFRLARMTEAVGGTERDIIIPGKSLRELQRVLSSSEAEECAVSIGEGQVLFTAGGTVVGARLLEGSFPDYERVVPAEYRTIVSFSTERLLSACERASVVTRDDEQRADAVCLKMDRESGAILVTAESPETGGVEEKIDAEVEGDPIEIVFKARYLLDGLAVVASESAKLSFTGPYGAACLTGMDDDRFMYIALPLKPAED